ncbi:BCD family MFS transporter [Roseiflexus sp.]|uniref:BCD family MFS transporter n=1 Tax=Roseiflexus sp. TaxID=2562120 RepID=UPI00398A69DA
MRWTTIFRLGLINVAVALTAVPIESTLNRIMISELLLPASLVALLIALPYAFSPIQIWIGSFSDRHPLLGLRRTPYTIIGLLLCAGGSALSPTAAFAIAENFWAGLPLGLLAFGAWGMGFNFATVSYLSLATDLSGEEYRARTVGVMWFMLIVGVIIAGISLSRMLRDYTPEALFTAFYTVCGIALLIGLAALWRLEARDSAPAPSKRRSFVQMIATVAGTSQARLFFVYLVLLLIAILGQDVLLEPFAADIFDVPVEVTTRYTSIWGAALLIGLLTTSPLARQRGKPFAAAIGGALVAIGLVVIALSGILGMPVIFTPSLIIFGFGSGISTAANLALMLDMTVPGQIGAFVGAWGVANSMARLLGTVLSGVTRDILTDLFDDRMPGYIIVFLLQAAAMVTSLALLPRISTVRFRNEAAPSARELAALAGEAQG